MSVTGTIAGVHFAPLLPWPWLALLTALAALAAAYALARRARGALWRSAALAVFLLWLAGPRLVVHSAEELPDIALLVVDQSASMQIADRAALAEAARRKIMAEAERLAPGLELRTVTVPDRGEGGTRLFSALHDALADIPPNRLAGIIAITDGVVHDAPAQPDWGNAPLHLLLPARGEQTDRSLRVLDAPRYGVVGHSVTLRLEIDDLGVAHPAPATTLSISQDGAPPRREDVPIGTPFTLDVPITRAGPSIVDLRTEPLPGAATDLNTRAILTINGVRDRLRVLLVSGEPHPGERTWRRLLKSDPAVDLVHFTILRPPEKDDLTPLDELALIAFPVRELFQTKINQFDLIILDRFQNRGILPLAYLRNIAAYVERGGALFVSVGPEFAGPGSLADTPLADVLPATPVEGAEGVIEGAFRPELTSLGERHPVTAPLENAGAPGAGKGPPWGPWYRHLAVQNWRGEVVMKAPDGQPLLILDRAGAGRVALLLSDQIWLWSRGHLGGGPQLELLKRTAHWLMREPELEEEAVFAEIGGGVLTVRSRSLAATPPAAAEVTRPDGRAETLSLTPAGEGLAVGRMPATEPGVWRVKVGTHVAYASVGLGDPLEMADLRVTAQRLGALAAKSGGSVHWLVPGGAPELKRTAYRASQSGTDWIGLPRHHDRLVTGVSATPLLPPWAALAMILGLILIAWREEGR
jgi:hypothetical protein